jgi:hypothetical protein
MVGGRTLYRHLGAGVRGLDLGPWKLRLNYMLTYSLVSKHLEPHVKLVVYVVREAACSRSYANFLSLQLYNERDSHESCKTNGLVSLTRGSNTGAFRTGTSIKHQNPEGWRFPRQSGGLSAFSIRKCFTRDSFAEGIIM